jgi:hypothetical protein
VENRPEPAAVAPAPTLLTDSGPVERRDALPNVYLLEGQASIRLRKLIKNTLFETQIDYKFVDGDISTFLRYKYYARDFTYRIGLFDAIEFPEIGGGPSGDFERVRGGLFLLGVPRDYNHRYFWLLQDDRLTFGDANDPDNRKNNLYTKLGFQYGTQFDERMNAIVGETRGRITPVLTAFRELGTQKGGLAAAITQSAELGHGAYTYTKLETEGLRRFDITETTFLVSRAHIGVFLNRPETEPVPQPRDRDGDGDIDPVPEFELYDVPQYELFRVGGREALRSIGENDDSIGTHEFHLTNEYFVPVFRNRDYDLGPLSFNNLYAIGYGGAGTVGFDYNQITKTDDYIFDAGLGAEMSITVRDFDVLFSFIYARAFKAPDELEGGKFRFSLRTIR